VSATPFFTVDRLDFAYSLSAENHLCREGEADAHFAVIKILVSSCERVRVPGARGWPLGADRAFLRQAIGSAGGRDHRLFIRRELFLVPFRAWHAGSKPPFVLLHLRRGVDVRAWPILRRRG
jgi:hypothetical protein